MRATTLPLPRARALFCALPLAFAAACGPAIDTGDGGAGGNPCGSAGCGGACAGPITGGSSCGQPPPPACAEDLGSTVPQTASGSTAGAHDSFAPICANSTAPEVAHAFTAPAAGIYRFDTTGSAFDTVLYALDGCAGAEIACNDDANGSASSLVVALSAGQRVVIVVDGFQEEMGDYVLDVTLAGAPGTCDDQGICGDWSSGCVACAEAGPCAMEFQACTASDECVAYGACAGHCKTAACFDACASAFPSGAPLFDDLTGCAVCDECSSDCAAFTDMYCP